TRASDRAGSTRTRRPPWPRGATAMLPPISKASPPNIFRSVRQGAPAAGADGSPAARVANAVREVLVVGHGGDPTATMGRSGGQRRRLLLGQLVEPHVRLAAHAAGAPDVDLQR